MKKILVFAALLLAATPALAAPAQPTRWISAWLAPPIGYEPNIKTALGRPFANETVRQTVHVTADGSQVRLRLSNELGDTLLKIGAVSIARADADGKVVAGSTKAVTFGGTANVTIPTRAPYLSDPVDMAVKAGDVLTVSIFYPDTYVQPPAHAQMVWVYGPGDRTKEDVLPTDAVRARAPGLVSGVDVIPTAPKRVLVAFGDSITEGAGSKGPYMSWPDQMARMMADTPKDQCFAVVNAGISGNKLMRGGRGPDALSRFDRDALAVPGVTTIVLLEGINDLGRIDDSDKQEQVITAEALVDSYRQMAERAHARGLKIIVGTLLPFKGAVYDSDDGQAKRLKVNAWIRDHASLFDGLIDFDTAMQEPGQPLVMRLTDQIGDHLHPNDDGYGRMARTALPVIEAVDPCKK